jgi:hypothetical protein
MDGPTYLIKHVVTLRNCFAKESKKNLKFKVAVFRVMTTVGKGPTFRDIFLAPLSTRKVICLCKMYGVISLVALEALDLPETQVTRISSSRHALLFKQSFDVKSFLCQ